MSGDTLSDLLRTVRLRGAVFYHVEGAAPWVAETPCAAEIIPGIMPGVEHMLEFHAVVSGSCWAAIVGETAVRPDRGRGAFRRAMRTSCPASPGCAHRGPTGLLLHPASAAAPSEAQHPGCRATLARCDLGGRECTQLVCGFLGLMRARSTRCWPPCRRAPRLRQRARRGLVGDGLMRSAVEEANQRRPGAKRC
jgi:hypothetical protein